MVKFSSFCLILWIGASYVASAPNSGYVYKPDADAWLRLHKVPATWAEAGMRCYLEGGMLASPTSIALANVMHNLMSERQMERVFTGINSILSTENFVSLDGVALDSIPLDWANGEPNNANKDEVCVALTGAGALEDVSCKRLMPYFCSKVNKNKCGDAGSGYLWKEKTGSCYKVHQTPATWHHSLATCRAEGGHLAIINSDVESSALKDILSAMPTLSFEPYYVFLGFKKYGGKNGEWATINGETLAEAGFAKWNVGEPNNKNNIEYCGSYVESGLLNDAPCNEEAPFICEIKPTP